MTDINSFKGNYFFLSNFYPCTVTYENVIYPSSENAYQAAKTISMSDRTQFTYISASEAKYLGKSLQLRSDWDNIKLSVMKIILESKFSDDYLKGKLLATYPHKLIEGNYWGDRFWGESPLGIGHNNLGLLLMEIRDSILGVK